ncbi:hypothetical protein [Halocalculus aciditolerans]|uniref:CHAT domain-containing protein n=1 Tax=Halocalculus aciditolerans TaxID=1383812 RepID=A0A830FGH7_9EURY|nr:hypothetical protein [Halocalculus aciditolerans]GGL53021.1 hypothetical protein GCM10009039_09050 [Halocalculus aciditolerans]
MIDWDVSGNGVRARDSANREVLVETPDWTPCGEPADLSHPVDATAAGDLSSFSLPPLYATILDLDTTETSDLSRDADAVDLPAGAYELNVDAAVKTYVKFRGPATIERTDDRLHVSLGDADRVTIGFRSRIRAPSATVTVPETVEGVAAAVAAASSALRTTRPDRSFETMRGHPPEVEFGDDYDVPAAVADAVPDTGIDVCVPRDLETLLTVAPLAYYLGADVSVEPGERARVRAPDADFAYDLGPNVVERAPALLARVFWLDCLVRNAGPHGMDVAETRLLDEFETTAAEFYAMAPDERLRAYVDAPYDRIADGLPDWHLAMHVEPTLQNAETLPFLLDRLSVIYPPETAELESQELMKRSLDDFYRAGVGPVAQVEMLKPRLRDGRVSGWLADGTPIDVFKTLPEAYENHLDYLDVSPGGISVAVVLNDEAMREEHERVAEIYRERAEDVDMDLRLEKNLTRAELAALLEDDHDFVHYIGHCEVDGLRCADGNLAVSTIEESNAQTFFLNACGSYHEGLELVRKGSVAGAVTFRKVLDEQAAKVGTAFAKLLVNGFSIDRAVRLARRRIMMGKDYAVVGDGTQVVTESEAAIPATVTVDSAGDRFAVTYDANSIWVHGGVYHARTPGPSSLHLCGNSIETELSAGQTVSFLEQEELPVILDGEFHWSDDAAERIREMS